jgi:GDP-L-fucose synthase
MTSDLLVTGGYGLVGSEFSNAIKFRSNQFNLTDQIQTQNMFAQYRPRHVIHAAAKVGGIKANMDLPGQFYLDNILMNTHVIEQARLHGVEKMICFLSTCVFPDGLNTCLDESKIHVGPPHSSNFAYAYAKRMCDIQLQAYNQQYGTKYFSVIPTNIYGPNDNYSLEHGHVLPSLIHRCYLAKQNNTQLTVWGSGKPLREFIFSKDVADLCLKLLDSDHHTTPVILSSMQEIAIADLVVLICDAMKFKGSIVFDGTKPDGQYRKNSTNAKLTSIIKDYKFTPIQQGIEITVDHFLNNFNRVRK